MRLFGCEIIWLFDYILFHKMKKTKNTKLMEQFQNKILKS